MNEYALIVAGGKGTRINAPIAKQFLPLNGKPILFHTIEAFTRYSETIRIIVVLPKDDFPVWHQLVSTHQFKIPVTLQEGGSSRFQSVKKGLEKITDVGLVAIHDGVRPLINADIIGASFRLAAVHGSAVASVRLKESIRVTDQDTTKALDRSKYRLVQTPQTFNIRLIKEAYEITEDESLTDDASVVERTGHRISLFEGNYENIKITTPEDLVVAEALLKSKAGL